MDAMNPVYTEKAECQDCYKCVRECAVKAIRVEGGRAAVIPELCVACGHCVMVCPVGAKKVRDDLSRAKALVATGRRVVVSLAPSFAADFEGLEPRKLIAAIKALGVDAVSETALGADMVARSVAEAMTASAKAQDGSGRAGGAGRTPVFISSACPAVAEYLGKYRPDAFGKVTRLLSPLQAHALELKASLGNDTALLFVGPCVAKKREADLRRDLIDVAIDFADLWTWFYEEGIDPWKVAAGPADVFSPRRAGSGALYPFDGGMVAAIASYPLPRGATLLSYSGLGKIAEALEGLEGLSACGPVFVELLACEGGCVNGPRTSAKTGSIRKRLAVEAYAGTAAAVGGHGARQIGAELAISPIAEPKPAEDQLEAALRRAGKYIHDDELNCGACGYDTCREFAAAMVSGKAEPEMCVSFMRKLAQKKANGLIKAIPSAVVIVDRDMRIAECNQAFARAAGSDAETLWEAKPGLEGVELNSLFPAASLFAAVQGGAGTVEREMRVGGKVYLATVFCIEDGELAGGVFQDVTAPWVRKDRVISKARKVIDKNLAVVQRIAYLLGENAAETEAALSSIIESFGGHDKGDEDEGGAA